MAHAPLLEVQKLGITFAARRAGDTAVQAVRGISFSMGREKLGIVGESGSGKSLTARAILQLMPHTARVSAARLRFDGIDLLAARPQELGALRGRRLTMVMQDPKHALNPVMTVGQQLAETCALHQAGAEREVQQRIREGLAAVRVRDPERILTQYPHQLSGGLAQRVMIAMMLLPGPDLLIADEPTSALDVTVKLQILAVLDDLVNSRNMGLLLISHDLNLVASFCDRILVMYQGRILEECAAGALAQARHPYTRGLLDCLPQADRYRRTLPTLQRDPQWLAGPGAAG